MSPRDLINTCSFFRRITMPTAPKLVRLKRQISAHRQALKALNAATSQLHQTLAGIIGAVDGQRSPALQKRPAKAPKQKHFGGAAPVRAAGRIGRSGSPTPAKRSDESDRAMAAALERHWGNLF
jgi:hypothetical protein